MDHRVQVPAELWPSIVILAVNTDRTPAATVRQLLHQAIVREFRTIERRNTKSSTT